MSKIGSVIGCWMGRMRFTRNSDAPIEVEADYDAVLQLIRQRASGYMAASSEILPDDNLVRRDRFGREDIGYFATNLEKALNLNIPQSEWANVNTVDDMVRLLVRHLNERKIKAVSL